MKTAIELIAIERGEQIEKHGFSLGNDADHQNGELLKAAMYCLTEDIAHYPENWNDWFPNNVRAKRMRMSTKQFKFEMLKIAAAFIVAEMERLDPTCAGIPDIF